MRRMDMRKRGTRKMKRKSRRQIVNKTGKGVEFFPCLAMTALLLITFVGFASVYSRGSEALAAAKPDEKRNISLIDREDDNTEVEDYEPSQFEAYGKILTADGEVIYGPANAEGGKTYTNLIGKIGIADVHTVAYAYREELYNSYSLINGLGHPAPELSLTINGNLQKTMTEYLEACNVDGTVLCSDVHTGEILCAVSTPAAASMEDYSREGGLMNKNFYTTVPGSTMKIVTTLLLEMEGISTEELVFGCGKTTALPDGNRITCEKDHGSAVTIEAALGDSCNCFFAQAIQLLDWDTVAADLCRLGFAVNAPEEVHRQTGKLVYRSSETAISGRNDFNSIFGLIGQGETLVSPLHMVQLTSAIAGAGEAVDPFLVQGDRGMEPLQLWEADREAFRRCREIWEKAFAEYYQPGIVYPEALVAAKTGTAQIGGLAQKKLLSGYTADVAFYIVIHNYITADGIKLSVTPVEIAEKMLEDVIQVDACGDLARDSGQL
ncbi:MAG: penicillin-binding transpeptidase domain-containing protein [Lachnospiraceae bacterium]|nr:penicillin-binding transpeptidase domain-containing protein [Lachnospiraceae bacterium]